MGTLTSLMYEFEAAFHKSIDTIHGYTVVKDVQNMALGILFFSVLYVLFQAWFRGRDVRHLGRGLLIFTLVCPILYNYHGAFLAVVDGFLDLARYINSAVGGRDTLANWRFELSSTYSQVNWFHIIGAAVVNLIALAVNFVAYTLFPLAILVFNFAFMCAGTLLYVLGPFFLATLPLSGLTPLGTAYLRNLLAVCLWPVVYAALNVMIEASSMHNAAGVAGGGFLQGDVAGGSHSIVVAFATIIYALMLMFIPLIVNRFLAGDVGSALFAMAGTLSMLARTSNLRGGSRSSGGGAGGGGGGGRGLAGAASGGGLPPKPPPGVEGEAVELVKNQDGVYVPKPPEPKPSVSAASQAWMRDQVGKWMGRSSNQSSTSAGDGPGTPPIPRGKHAY